MVRNGTMRRPVLWRRRKITNSVSHGVSLGDWLGPDEFLTATNPDEKRPTAVLGQTVFGSIEDLRICTISELVCAIFNGLNYVVTPDTANGLNVFNQECAWPDLCEPVEVSKDQEVSRIISRTAPLQRESLAWRTTRQEV